MPADLPHVGRRRRVVLIGTAIIAGSAAAVALWIMTMLTPAGWVLVALAALAVVVQGRQP